MAYKRNTQGAPEPTASLTNFGRNSSNDDLLLTCCFDCCFEFRIVPGINLAISPDIWRVRMHLDDLLGQRPVWTCHALVRKAFYYLQRALPVSADVVKIVGKLNRFPNAA
jgi:hypothetical protein